MRIVVSGGTGFLGSALVARLRHDGHEVVVLTRRPRGSGEVGWSPQAAAPTDALVRAVDGAGAVVNLAGAPIAGGRWTATRKRAIRDSRVTATRALASAIAAAARPPSAMISGSGVDVYGPHGDEVLTEDAPPGSGFLAEVAAEWEAAAAGVPPATRLVLLRTAMALGRAGGALPVIARPFRLFVGGRVGSGRQYMSWIHRDDWVEIVRWAIGNDAVSGPLNAAAPEPVTNAEFTRTLARVLRRPAVLPAPAFALRLLLGEMASLMLDGRRVLPAKAQTLGFAFRYPALEPALRAIYGSSA